MISAKIFIHLLSLEYQYSNKCLSNIVKVLTMKDRKKENMKYVILTIILRAVYTLQLYINCM